MQAEESEFLPQSLKKGQHIKVLAHPFTKTADAKKMVRALCSPLARFSAEERTRLRWIRVEVVDSDAKSVQVHFPKTPKKFNSWMPKERCRLIQHIRIDWQSFGDMLPIDMEPASRRIRKETFERWDTNGKGQVLTLAELQNGVRLFVGCDLGDDFEDLDSCIKLAFQSTRNLSPQGCGKTVDRTEFHAFLICLRWYLEAGEIFAEMDCRFDGNQLLSLREMLRGKDLLASWGITEEMVREAFADPDVEIWTPILKFEDFAQWCVEKRWGETDLELELDEDAQEVALPARTEAEVVVPDDDSFNRRKIVAAFQRYDADGDGTISEDELFAVFSSLTPPLPPDKLRRMFQLADANRDGVVDYEEFCTWLFTPLFGVEG